MSECLVAGHGKKRIPRNQIAKFLLIRSVIENDVPRNTNVYAELGSTWRYVMRDPDSAAHTVGKLVKNGGAALISFARYEVGEGIEKEEVDFAEEVAAQLK